MRVLRAREIPVVGASRHPEPDGVVLDVTVERDLARVLGEVNPSVLIDAAGATDVDRCEIEPAWADAVNVAATEVLASSLDPSCVLVYLSTCNVFDGKGGPYDERATPAPINVYGRSKLEGETRAAEHSEHLVVRTTVVYGRESSDAGKNSLYQLHAALRAGDPFVASTDEVSTPTYAHDLAEMLIDLLLADVRGCLHVGGADLMSRFDYARVSAEVLGLDPGLVQPAVSAERKRPAARPLRHGLVSSAAEAVVGRSTAGVREGVGSARRELGW